LTALLKIAQAANCTARTRKIKGKCG